MTYLTCTTSLQSIAKNRTFQLTEMGELFWLHIDHLLIQLRRTLLCNSRTKLNANSLRWGLRICKCHGKCVKLASAPAIGRESSQSGEKANLVWSRSSLTPKEWQSFPVSGLWRETSFLLAPMIENDTSTLANPCKGYLWRRNSDEEAFAYWLKIVSIRNNRRTAMWSVGEGGKEDRAQSQSLGRR